MGDEYFVCCNCGTSYEIDYLEIDGVATVVKPTVKNRVKCPLCGALMEYCPNYDVKYELVKGLKCVRNALNERTKFLAEQFDKHIEKQEAD